MAHDPITLGFVSEMTAQAISLNQARAAIFCASISCPVSRSYCLLLNTLYHPPLHPYSSLVFCFSSGFLLMATDGRRNIIIMQCVLFSFLFPSMTCTKRISHRIHICCMHHFAYRHHIFREAQLCWPLLASAYQMIRIIPSHSNNFTSLLRTKSYASFAHSHCITDHVDTNSDRIHSINNRVG